MLGIIARPESPLYYIDLFPKFPSVVVRVDIAENDNKRKEEYVSDWIWKGNDYEFRNKMEIKYFKKHCEATLKYYKEKLTEGFQLFKKQSLAKYEAIEDSYLYVMGKIDEDYKLFEFDFYEHPENLNGQERIIIRRFSKKDMDKLKFGVY